MKTLTITRHYKPTLDQRWMVRRMRETINSVDRILTFASAVAEGVGGYVEMPRMSGQVEPDGRSIVVLEFGDDASEAFIREIEKFLSAHPNLHRYTLTECA